MQMATSTARHYKVHLLLTIPASEQFSNSRLVASFAASFHSAAPTAPAPMVRSRWVTKAASTARHSPVGPVIWAPCFKLARMATWPRSRSEEHTSELQSLRHLVCRLLLEK